MPYEELQQRMSSREFSTWMVLDSRGELPDDYDLFGMVAATAANAGFNTPKKPVRPEHFRPKFVTKEQQRQREITAAERMTACKDNDLTWRT